MKILLDKGAILPTRAHPFDAGLDLYSPVDVLIQWYEQAVTIDTGVHVEIPEGYVGFIKSRSGLMVKHNIVSDGTIDAHYTGSIRVRLFKHSIDEYQVNAGDKIAQLVILKCELPELEVVDHLEETDRGDGGFGSTGR